MMTFNLLPYRAKLRRRRRLQFFAALMFAMLLGCATSGIGWHAVGSRQKIQQTRNEWLRQASVRTEREIKQGARLQSETDAVMHDIAKIEKWRNQRDGATSMLATLATQIPPEAHLKKIYKQDGKVKIDGFAASNPVVTELLQDLNRQTDRISSAQLLETHAENRAESGVAFSIAMTLR